MTAQDAAIVITAIVGAVTTIVGVILGPKTLDAVLRYRRESQKLWTERLRVEREQRVAEWSEEDRRNAEKRSADETANVAAYKAMIARLEMDITDLKQRLDNTLKDAHDCHATCAGLRVANEHLDRECKELRGEMEQMKDRIERLEGR